MILKRYISVLIFLIPVLLAGAQDIPATPSEIGTGTYLGLSKPLRDLPVISASDWKAMEKRAKKELNEGLQKRSYPYASTALPKGPDTFFQKNMGSQHNTAGQIVNFDGQTSPYYPPDCNGTAGPNHFMQTINTVYAIYTKDGTKVAGPTAVNTLFGTVPGSNYNNGDPVILYDEHADRWLVTEISISGSTNYLLLAVSSTNDPTGTWHRYSFQVATMPDYAKVSVWRDGYYMGDNNGGSTDIYVFQRDSILVGGTAQKVGFHNSWRPAPSWDGFMCVPPVDNDGQLAPAGSPGLYVAVNDDAYGGGTDQLWIYELHVDWNNTANSTFNRAQQLNVQPFTSNFGSSWDNVPQKGTSQKVDAIPLTIMNVPQYRNFGSYQTIVCCHTVNLGTPPNNNHAGVRWYELRRTTGLWNIRQQGTFAPDSNSRWMASIMLNGSKTIALGYSVSNTTMYPSIRYCGQSPMAYLSGNNTLDIAEDTIIKGQHSQTSQNRWGDYSLMSVDPVDTNTFWFTDEYIGSSGSRKTRIASFKFAFPPLVTTTGASDITGVSATLNGTVNPYGATATGYFIWGPTPMSLTNTTTPDSVGSGMSTVNISKSISGLMPNTLYYYSAVGSNPNGIANGDTLSFSTIQPSLAVTPPNRSVGDTSGQTRFFVTSNINWFVSSDASWCVPIASGSGNDTIFTAFTTNTSTIPRMATLIVSGNGVPAVTVTVTQAGVSPELIVTPPNRDVAADTGRTNYNVLSNIAWTVSADTNWCTVTPSGIGNGIIVATYTANPDIVQRIAHISTFGSGIGPVVVTVTQAGAAPTLNVIPPDQNVTAVTGSINYTVTSNTNWTVQCDSSWCTVTPSGSKNGTIVANYTANTGNIARTAHISVAATGVTPVSVNLIQAKSSSGINETKAGRVDIYPNPNKGIFNIVPAEGSRIILNIEVKDMNGKTLLKKELKGESEYQIDLSAAEAGTYNIVISSDSYLVIKKVVIIR
ncbi:MAG: BACON domain-containing carbohydrate-binding protein [Bacteroidetes bacterium]|nr:BACON domain-containing carbohydrate-binding protein [Bacteroidota bacterium]